MESNQAQRTVKTVNPLFGRTHIILDGMPAFILDGDTIIFQDEQNCIRTKLRGTRYVGVRVSSFLTHIVAKTSYGRAVEFGLEIADYIEKFGSEAVLRAVRGLENQPVDGEGKTL